MICQLFAYSGRLKFGKTFQLQKLSVCRINSGNVTPLSPIVSYYKIGFLCCKRRIKDGTPTKS